MVAGGMAAAGPGRGSPVDGHPLVNESRPAVPGPCTSRPCGLGRLPTVSDYVIPEPEPKEIDEKLSIDLRHLADNAVLRGQPPGDEKCESCRDHLEPYNEAPRTAGTRSSRILVGGEWWCQWWEAIPEDEA